MPELLDRLVRGIDGSIFVHELPRRHLLGVDRGIAGFELHGLHGGHLRVDGRVQHLRGLPRGHLRSGRGDDVMF